jgi:ABC-type multidrug transport system ATPase subunit
MEKADPHPSPAVAISHLTVAKGGATMLSDVSASIGRGAKVVLKGASGSGKSTLLQAIMGFVPFSGSLRLFGTAVQPGTIQALRLRTAYVGQQTAIGQERVSAYVAEILHARHNQHLQQPYQQLGSYFKQLHLPDRIWEQAASALSGGERQRVLLALAMALNRELYLLDEPTSALDPALQQEVISWLSNQSDATIVVAAHNQSWEAAGWQTLHMPSAYE